MQSQCTEHSAAVLEEPVSPLGTGSPTPISVSIPKGMTAHPLGTVSHTGDGARMTDSHRVTKGCSGIEGAIGGLASAAHHALYSVPLREHPVSQPIIYGDLNSGTVTKNLGSQSGVPNLFGLPAPVYAGTVPAGEFNTAPMGAACARSAAVARADKIGTETALRDQHLANYEARLRQEGSVSSVQNAVASASIPRGAEHSQMGPLYGQERSPR